MIRAHVLALMAARFWIQRARDGSGYTFEKSLDDAEGLLEMAEQRSPEKAPILNLAPKQSPQIAGNFSEPPRRPDPIHVPDKP